MNRTVNELPRVKRIHQHEVREVIYDVTMTYGIAVHEFEWGGNRKSVRRTGGQLREQGTHIALGGATERTSRFLPKKTSLSVNGFISDRDKFTNLSDDARVTTYLTPDAISASRFDSIGGVKRSLKAGARKLHSSVFPPQETSLEEKHFSINITGDRQLGFVNIIECEEEGGKESFYVIKNDGTILRTKGLAVGTIFLGVLVAVPIMTLVAAIGGEDDSTLSKEPSQDDITKDVAVVIQLRDGVNLNVREYASTNSTVISTLAAGERVEINTCTNSNDGKPVIPHEVYGNSSYWCEIIAERGGGWVRADFIARR